MAKDNLRKLASEIAFKEGKKSQARIYDIREILNIICTLDAEFDLSGEGANGVRSPIAILIDQSDKIFIKLSKRRKKA